MTRDEYGRDEGTLLLPPGQSKVRQTNGRLVVPMVKLIEIQNNDMRMGRTVNS